MYHFDNLDLLEEIISDRQKINSYICSIEEACEVIEDLEDRIKENENIILNAKEDIDSNSLSMSNEHIALCLSRLDYYATYKNEISLEYCTSNIQKLVLSTEGIKDIIKNIIEKIKTVFKKVVEVSKKLYVKMMVYMDNYTSKLKQLQKEFNAILNKDDIKLDKKVIEEIIKSSPILFSVVNSNKLDLILKDFSKLIHDLTLPIINNNINKTIDLLIDGASVTNSNEIRKIVNLYEKDSGNKNIIGLITNINKNKIKFIKVSAGHIAGYEEYKFKDLNHNIRNLNNLTINKSSMDNYINGLLNLISNLKKDVNDILKLQDHLDKLMHKIEYSHDDEKRKKDNLHAIRVLGTNASIDMSMFLIEILRFNGKICSSIYKWLDEDSVQNNYTEIINVLINDGYTDAELKYLDNNIKYPYINMGNKLSTYVLENQHVLGGFCYLIKDPALDEYFHGVDYTSVVFLDEDFLLGKTSRHLDGVDIEFGIAGNKGLRFTYFHEVGHCILKQNESKQASLFVSFLLNGGSSDRVYVDSYVENQADCYAMLKCGMSIKELAEIRCDKIMPWLSEKKNEYIANIQKHLSYVKSLAKLSTWEQILSHVKKTN